MSNSHIICILSIYAMYGYLILSTFIGFRYHLYFSLISEETKMRKALPKEKFLTLKWRANKLLSNLKHFEH